MMDGCWMGEDELDAKIRKERKTWKASMSLIQSPKN